MERKIVMKFFGDSGKSCHIGLCQVLVDLSKRNDMDSLFQSLPVKLKFGKSQKVTLFLPYLPENHRSVLMAIHWNDAISTFFIFPILLIIDFQQRNWFFVLSALQISVLSASSFHNKQSLQSGIFVTMFQDYFKIDLDLDVCVLDNSQNELCHFTFNLPFSF